MQYIYIYLMKSVPAIFVLNLVSKELALRGKIVCKYV